MSLPSYPTYKDSGVAWLGQVPAHWRVDRFKASIDSCKNGIWGDEPSGNGNDIACVRVADFDRVKLGVKEHIPTLRNVSDKERVGRLLTRGDLLLEKSGGGELQPVGQVVMYDLEAPAVCSNFVAKLSLARDMVPAYWNYVHSAAYSVRLNIGAINQTSGIQNLDQDRYFNERAPFPPSGEQAAIATFLDRETSKIDALIAEQEKLLVLLAEKRQATIAHAVTRGLNPEALMKDSGVEWLGEVPVHWKTGKIQSFARRESGHTPSRQRPEYWENCTIPWFSLADVWQIREGNVKYVYETNERVSELGLANSSARLLPAGTVILSRTASVGYSAIMGCDMATTQDFVNWVCAPGLQPEFLLYVLRGMRSEFDRLMMGSTHQTIYMPDIAKLAMALPSPEEQLAIVQFLDSVVTKLNGLKSEAEQAIALFRERRSALISAAVTGKIDVRNAVPEELAA